MEHKRLELFIKNYIFILIARILRISVGFLLLFGVARYLPVADFGDFVFIINITASVMSIAFYGIGQALVRDVSRDKASASQYVGAAFKLRSRLVLASFLALMIVCMIMDIRGLMFLALIIAAVSEIFRAFSDLTKDVYRSFERMRYETLVVTIYSAIVLVLIAAVIYHGATTILIIVAICLANLLQFLFSVRIMLKEFVVPASTVESDVMKTFVKDAIGLGVGALFAQLVWRAPALVLKKTSGPVDVAIFEASHSLILQTLILNEVFITVFLPGLSALIPNREHKSIQQLGVRLFKVLLLFSINISLILFVFHSEIIRLLYGDKYALSGFVLTTLSPALIFLFLTGLCHIFLISMKLQKQFVLCNAVSALALLMMLPLAAYRHGYKGAAIASLIAYVVNFVCSLYMTDKHVFKLPYRATLKAFGLSVIIAIASATVRESNQIAAFLVLQLSFLAMVLKAGVLDTQEIQYIKNIIKRRGISVPPLS
ncbi:MAG: flippase [Nitrospirae bacterium]|nr:flippase [Nitrospirota bacterium]